MDKKLTVSSLSFGIIPAHHQKKIKKKRGGGKPFLSARGKIKKTAQLEDSADLPTGFTAIKLQGEINYG